MLFGLMVDRSLVFLDADAVRAAMPPVAERIELARRTLIGLAQGAELPAKVGVHPRSADAFSAAMPALLPGPATDGSADLLGMKWVLAFPANRERGLPAISATVILNDATTGLPVAILDGGPITAQRTAAVSGAALAAARIRAGARITLVGAGIQGHSHVEVLAHVARGAALTIADRHADRAAALAESARHSGAFASVESTADAASAIASADVVLTMVSFGPDRQALPATAFAAASVIVAIDYDMCVPAAVARRASLFLTDHAEQLRAARHGEVFAGYPDPDATIGEWLLGRSPAPRPSGPVYVNHLGVGLADVVFADAVLSRARQLGLGIALPKTP
jgi:ornithine cyclodeaminase/alanine dehydrogenase-like protein (mu-crystallin family)